MSASAVNLAGARAVVVGGTSGIGRAIALRLARANASVIIIGRSASRGDEVVAAMQSEASEEAVPPPHFSFLQIDAGQLAAAREAAAEVQAALKESDDGASNTDPGIDFLVLTQGIATIKGRTLTQDGLDEKLSIHYFSRVAFMKAFVPLLERSVRDPRVLTVLSAGVHSPYRGYASDFELERSFSLKNVADAAGFYNDIAVDQMANEHPNIIFTHAAPGFIRSPWGRQMPAPLRFLIRGFQLFARSEADCAENMIQALVNPSYKSAPKSPGWHLMDPNARPAQKTVLHDEARQEVWERTLEVLKRTNALDG